MKPISPHFPADLALDLTTFDYDLPDERIAKRPTAERQQSRLLLSHKDKPLVHHHFGDIVDLIAPNTLMVLNTSKVIRARIEMKKESGGLAELLVLDPIAPSTDPAKALVTRGKVTVHALVGGKRIRVGHRLTQISATSEPITLLAEVIERDGRNAVVNLSWEPAAPTFGQVLDRFGVPPLPPYLHRPSDADDVVRYQTVYAVHDGSVAAPTAGLHFTPELLATLATRGVRQAHVALHVGAGTFQPVESTVQEHTMHREQIIVEKSEVVRMLAAAAAREHGPTRILAIGTTSVRTIESLYWFGVRLIRNDKDCQRLPLFSVDQWDPYRLAESGTLPTAPAALESLLRWAEQHQLDPIAGSTQILIVPGYTFALTDRLLTNFHQPKSTLLMLVSALIGEPRRKQLYEEALANGYRFLSYGDACLLG